MNDDQCWQAVRARDASFDGRFWYGVLTTGVYCKPSCASRRANRGNVRFYASIDEAQHAGLRACKRCKPDAQHLKLGDSQSTLVQLLELCRYIEAHPTRAHALQVLSRRVELSPFQLHRLFKSFLQITPKQYVEQVRMRALKERLRAAPSVTDAVYESGFESSSAVYGRLDAHLGMTPRKYRQGGRGVDISFAFGATSLGKVLIGATDRGVCYLQFGESERELLEQLTVEYPQALITPSTQTGGAAFDAWMQALNRHLSGKRSKVDLPLDIQGTAFQKRVWEFLRTIPIGEVVSYAEVADAVGAPKAIRAAASACASNRIGVLIPCHRVIRGTGALGGYRWGLPRKRALLDVERSMRARVNKSERKS